MSVKPYEGPGVASREYNADEVSRLMQEVRRIAREASVNVPALRVGQILRRDGEALDFELLNRVQPPAAGLLVAMPSAAAVDGGRALEVAVLSAAGAVTYKAAGGVLVNGVDGFAAAAAVSLRRFRWDGSGWFTEP